MIPRRVVQVAVAIVLIFAAPSIGLAARHRTLEGTVDLLLGLEVRPLAIAPLCDPDDTQERAIVSAVTHVIRHMRMTHQVLLTSFSPVLLYLAHRHAPEIERILAVSGLQFLTKEEIEAALGQPVTLIDKDLDLGPQWAELGHRC